MFCVFISLFSLRTGQEENKSFFCFLARKKRDEKSEKSSSGQCFLSLFAKNFFSSEKIMNASAEKANEKKAEDRSNDNVTEKSPISSPSLFLKKYRKSLGSDRERDSFGLRAARRCVELNGRKGEILESKREHRRKFE